MSAKPPLEVRNSFSASRLHLPPEDRAKAFAEWKVEQKAAAKRKREEAKPVAERLYTLADLEEAERWAGETPGSGNNPNKHRGRIKTARLMVDIIRAQLTKRGLLSK